MSARDVADLVTEGGFAITRSQVALNAPIKTIGQHKVEIALHPEVEVNVAVIVARNAEEAERVKRGEDVTVRREDAEVEREVAAAAAEAFFDPEARDDDEDERGRSLGAGRKGLTASSTTIMPGALPGMNKMLRAEFPARPAFPRPAANWPMCWARLGFGPSGGAAAGGGVRAAAATGGLRLLAGSRSGGRAASWGLRSSAPDRCRRPLDRGLPRGRRDRRCAALGDARKFASAPACWTLDV